MAYLLAETSYRNFRNRSLSKFYCILVALFALCSPLRADFCEDTDARRWEEITQLASAGPKRSNRPTVFLLAAPWCPYCKDMFSEASKRKLSFDLQFIPVQPKNDRHKLQVVDMFKDQSVASLIRVYQRNDSS
jgi:thiol-disulfide isomerase/thioredoxin